MTWRTFGVVAATTLAFSGTGAAIAATQSGSHTATKHVVKASAKTKSTRTRTGPCPNMPSSTTTTPNG